MNLKSKVGIILIAFSVVLYFAGYFFLVEHTPNPITNTLNFFNSMLVIKQTTNFALQGGVAHNKSLLR